MRGVIRSVRSKTDGNLYCAKSIRKIQKGKSVESEIRAEIESLERLADHDGIVTIRGVYETNRETTLILDLHQRDLHQLIDFDEKIDAKKIVNSLIRIVKDIHEKGIIHLDLKPQNVLLTEANDLKVCDFGLAQFENDDNKENLLLGGTLEYCAPEQIQFEPVTTKTDVWSLGVIAYVLATKHSPFKREAGDHATQNAILEVDFDLDLVACPEAKKFITSCLKRSPSDRPSCVELLESEWFSRRKLSKKRSSSTSSDLLSPRLTPRYEENEDLNPIKKSRHDTIEETVL